MDNSFTITPSFAPDIQREPGYHECHARFVPEGGEPFTGSCDSAIQHLKQLQTKDFGARNRLLKLSRSKNPKITGLIIDKYYSENGTRLGMHVQQTKALSASQVQELISEVAKDHRK